MTIVNKAKIRYPRKTPLKRYIQLQYDHYHDGPSDSTSYDISDNVCRDLQS